MAEERHDVVVVGAGYAGLIAALELVEAGLDVVVLEAADRPGGRTLTEVRAGVGPIDHGGQWVGPTQTELLAVAERFGCATFRSYDAGTHADRWPNGRTFWAPTGGQSDAPGQAGYAEFVVRVEELAATIDTTAPWTSPDARWLDSVTVESQLTGMDAAAAARVRLGVQGVWAVEPRELSMLHLAFYVAAAGSWDQLMLTLDNAQDSRFVGGAQTPALAIADFLGEERVRLGAAVADIAQDADGVTVRSAAGVFRAGHAVVTVPPPAVRAIEFTPSLPYARRRWVERSVMGDVAKIHVAYPRPFWRDEGLSGQASLYTDEHVGVVFDNSPADVSCGVLVAFVYGDRLRDWARLPDAERRRSVLDSLIGIVGERAGEPVDYTEKNWTTDDWAGGAYAATPAPGAWIEYGPDGWRERTGRIHWAGTELADRWNGYIDGAIRSGRRAAQEILSLPTPGR